MIWSSWVLNWSEITYMSPNLQVSWVPNQNWMRYADDKVKQRRFQQSRGCNSKTNDLIWPVLELVWDFIHVHLICKFREDPIKSERVTLMTKSNRGFFSIQGESKTNDLIWSVLELVFYPCTPYLQKSFRNSQSKLKLWWWQAFSNSKPMGPCGYHSNRSIRGISMKSFWQWCPKRGMLQMWNDWDQPTDYGDVTGRRCLPSCKLPWSIRSCVS